MLTSIDEQSPDIAQGVNRALEYRTLADLTEGQTEATGAGDQGMMFGYASDETEELMPLPISLAHGLTIRLAELKNLELNFSDQTESPQVTVEYEGDRPVRIDTVVIAAQHHPDVDIDLLHKEIKEKVILPIMPGNLMDDQTRILINPTGRFVVGGPQGDAGLTGRKIIVDTYGGMARHGGGAFSGKDPTKVDRSAAYAARHVAKNVVAAGLASRCEVQLAYAIGVAEPVSIGVDTFGTGKLGEKALIKLIRKYFDLRPAAIIKELDLRRPIYKKLASYGHFGRKDLDLSWEKTDKASILQKEAGL